MIEASGSAALGIAQVVFEVDGEALPPVTSAPFRATVTVPPAATTASLVIRAIAFDAGGTELASDAVIVPVVLGLRFERPISGVPLGDTALLRLVTSSPPAADLAIELAAHDPAVVGVPATAVLAAGETEVAIPATGLAEGATAVIATSSQGLASTIASVSEAQPIEPGAAVLAAPQGVSVRTFPSLGHVHLPAGATRTLRVRLLATPAPAALPVAVESDDPAVVALGAAATIPAGDTSALLTLVAGAPGEAKLVLRAGGEGRELRVVVGDAPPPDRTTPVLAAPTGVLVISLPSAGSVIVAPGGTTSVKVPLFTEPLESATRIVVTSSAPEVAAVTQEVIVPAGATDVTLPIQTGVAGEALLVVRPEGDLRTGRELRVVVGAPEPGATPPVLAAPIGATVFHLPSAGAVVVAPDGAASVTLPLFEEPVASATRLVVTSSAPEVAAVTQEVVVPAGSTGATLPIQTGVAGEAILVVRPEGDLRTGRELRVVVGTPAPGTTPPVLAAPIGVVVREPGTLATLFLEPGAERTVTLDLLPYPSLANLPVRATSRDPSVATVAPAQQVLPVGERSASFTVRALGGDGDEVLVDVEVAGERRTLLVVVGVPAPEARPNAVAPPVGVEVGTE